MQYLLMLMFSDIADAGESTQTCILSLKVILNLSVYQYWIKNSYCFHNCGESKGAMVCQYHQLCRQRMSAFQIYCCYFEYISSRFTFFAQSTLSLLSDSDYGEMKRVRQSVLFLCLNYSFASLQSEIWKASQYEVLELKLRSLHFRTIVPAAAQTHINVKLLLLFSSWLGFRM